MNLQKKLTRNNRRTGGVSMEKQKVITSTEKHKVIIISILYVITVIIMFLGIYFSIFSLINNISFQVLNASIPGMIIGMLVFYLGLKYFFLVKKLRTELYKNSSKFAWGNFKKKKRAGSRILSK
jgi:hypothetical protein